MRRDSLGNYSEKCIGCGAPVHEYAAEFICNDCYPLLRNATICECGDRCCHNHYRCGYKLVGDDLVTQAPLPYQFKSQAASEGKPGRTW